MARPINRLSARSIAAATRPGYHPDGAGLYLQVTAAGSKSWIYRFTLRGRAREMGLGPLPLVGLAEARGRAAEARRLLFEGIDPIEHRRSAAAAVEAVPTFAAAAAAYIEAHRAGWRNAKHAEQWANTLETYAHPVIGATRVDAITTDDVLAVLRPIWSAKTETASRVRQRIESVIDADMAKRRAAGTNPARWRGHLAKLLPRPTKVSKVEHHAALPIADTPAFVELLRQQPVEAARAAELAILTACRTGEVTGADWSEIDLAARTWTIPSSRMKAGVEHVVPLSPRALAILRAQAELHGPVGLAFRYRGRRLSENAMLALLRRMGRSDITMHGFRSTFRDWAAECTDYPREVAEMSLAHRIKDKTEAAYRRGELLAKRRDLMEDWGAFCAGI